MTFSLGSILIPMVLVFKVAELARFWLSLQNVSDATGLKNVNLSTRTISGSVGKFIVEVVKNPNDWVLYLRRGSLPTNLLLESEIQLNEESDIQIGERDFDNYVRVVGESRAMALAILSPEMRKQLLPLIRRGLRLEGGVVSIHEKFATEIPALIQSVVGLATELSLIDEIPVRLLQNFRKEKRGTARLWLLVALAREAPSSKSAQDAFELGLEDEDDGVRLLSHALQGTFSSDLLSRLWTNPRTLDTLLRAMTLLLSELPVTPERSAEILRGALTSPRGEVRLNAIRLLGRIRDKDSLETLFKMADKCLEKDILNAIVQSIIQIDGAEVESFLVNLLNTQGPQCPLSVFKALGRVGSWGALEPLLKIVKEDVDVFHLTPVVIEAEAAIGLIRARLGPAEQGGLSLSSLGEADGGISLANSGGELSAGENDG